MYKILFVMNDSIVNNVTTSPAPKKRGRRRKDDPPIVLTVEEKPPEVKKRGRKPKGGKLISKDEIVNEQMSTAQNVILHLKCSTHDLEEKNEELSFIDPLKYNPSVPPQIQSYAPQEQTQYFDLNDTDNVSVVDNNAIAYPGTINETSMLCSKCKDGLSKNSDDVDVDDNEIEEKLKELKIAFYKNNVHDKRSACFWCTYEFDNQPCYIPKYEMNGEIFGYGSFCRPPCAVAHLMNENIDDSVKFEQYQLLNQIYGKIYDYKKNIRPAPDPHMLLEKFYGNMSIKEYRRLLNSDHVLFVVEKPMTRLLPELHEENDDSKKNGGNNYNQSGMYKVKKNSEKRKGPSKKEIMMDTFGC